MNTLITWKDRDRVYVRNSFHVIIRHMKQIQDLESTSEDRGSSHRTDWLPIGFFTDSYSREMPLLPEWQKVRTYLENFRILFRSDQGRTCMDGVSDIVIYGITLTSIDKYLVCDVWARSAYLWVGISGHVVNGQCDILKKWNELVRSGHCFFRHALCMTWHRKTSHSGWWETGG